MNRSDFQQLAELRIKEAQILIKNKCYEGAYYLAGYAVECALKACIAKKTKRFDFPPKDKIVRDLYTHELNKLINQAGLQMILEARGKSDIQFESNWAVVKDWKEDVRYETKIDDKRASDLYSAIVDKKHGVLSWLKKYW